MAYLPTEAVETLAAQLQTATRAGDLASAYRVLIPLELEAIKQVVLHAGYAVMACRQKPEVLRDLQSQLAQASAWRADGWALRERGNGRG